MNLKTTVSNSINGTCEELGDGLTPEKALAHYKKLSKEEQDKDVKPMNTMLTLFKLFDGVRIYRLNW